MQFRVLLVGFLVIAVAACGGDDDASDTTTTEPVTTTSVTTSEAPTTSADPGTVAPVATAPWGLDAIEMPDSEEAVAAVFAALPGELGGSPRSDVSGRFEGSLAVEYGGEMRTIRATPVAAVAPADDSGMTPVEWLGLMSGGLEGEVEGMALDPSAPLAWMASAEQVDDDVAYLAMWCVPDGAWYFEAIADSPDARLELIQSFVAAVAEA